MKKITQEELALDIHSASHLSLELCVAIAQDLAGKGYRKLPKTTENYRRRKGDETDA